MISQRFSSWALIAAFISFSGCKDEPRYRGKTAAMWANALGSKEEYKRREACENLRDMGEQASSEVQRVARLLDDANPGVVDFCAEALSKMGMHALPVLEPYLQADDPFVRVHAAGAMIKIDPTNKASQKALVKAYSGLGNAELATKASYLITRQGDVMVPYLVTLLDSDYDELRLNTVKTLGKIAEKARSLAVQPRIRVAQTDKNWRIRKAAMHSIAAIATVDQSTPVFRKAIEEESEESEEVRDTAAMMLKYTGVRKSSTGMEGVEEEASKTHVKASQGDAGGKSEILIQVR